MPNKTSKIKRNYYLINIPSDYLGNETKEDKDHRFSLAIDIARESANKYIIPCQWRLIWDNGEDVKIVREHY